MRSATKRSAIGIVVLLVAIALLLPMSGCIDEGSPVEQKVTFGLSTPYMEARDTGSGTVWDAELGLSKKRLRIAQPDEVQTLTGFEVGGVPPVGHEPRLRTVIDDSLGRFDWLWAAAGSGHAVFPIRYTRLVDITAGEVMDLAEE